MGGETLFYGSEPPQGTGDICSDAEAAGDVRLAFGIPGAANEMHRCLQFWLFAASEMESGELSANQAS